MMNPPQLPSMPPRGLTWPMVAYAFVRELTYLALVLGGTALSVVLAYRSPGELVTIAPMGVSAVLAILGKSRPSEPLDVSKMTGGAGLILLLIRAKLGV